MPLDKVANGCLLVAVSTETLPLSSDFLCMLWIKSWAKVWHSNHLSCRQAW